MAEIMDLHTEIEEKKIIRGNNKGMLLKKELNDEVEELNEQSKRMQALIEKIYDLPDSASKDLAQECISEVLTFYGNGLERILNILIEEGNAASTKILNDLIDDSFISGLLIIHNLHPLDMETRFNLALEKVRPYIQSHGGNVELLSLKDGMAKIKLSGSCKSCASSSVTLELAIKQAIEESCPDLLQLDVEGIEAPKNGHQHNGNHNDQIKVEPPSMSGWKKVDGIDNLANGTMKFVELNNIQVIICKTNDQLYAYRNNCPACDMPISTGTIENGVIACRLGHRYDIQHAGKCTDDPSLHLDPIPLLKENGIVKVAIG